jgi:hypothetical protein
MTETGFRILVLKSSSSDAKEVRATLSRAGWEVWLGRTVQDGLLLSARLKFDAVIADESCSKSCPDLWHQLEDTLPEALWIIHRDRSSLGHRKQNQANLLGRDSEVLLAVLLLALETKSERSRASAA